MSDSEIHSPSPGGWREQDWTSLLFAIRNNQCTPFLGAGASAAILPTGQQIARILAREYGYPFRQQYNLARVAQYGAVDVGDMDPKYRIIDIFNKTVSHKGPDFNDPDQLHRMVAELPFPVFITTNYDDFMTQALEHAGKSPRREICKWYEAKKPSETRQDPASDDDKFRPTADEPAVFHLHGHVKDPKSIVVTQDDYLNFLINISEDKDVIPDYIDAAFTNSTLLFIGYSLEDMNFRVLFRKFAEHMRRSGGNRHVSVQLTPKLFEVPAKLKERSEKQFKYLQTQLGNQSIKAYWGPADEFVRQLRTKWRAFKSGE